MDQIQNRRIAAVKAADAINAIEITDQQMKSALLASHRKLAAMVRSRV